MGGSLSTCTSSCTRPPSPTESTSSFLSGPMKSQVLLDPPSKDSCSTHYAASTGTKCDQTCSCYCPDSKNPPTAVSECPADSTKDPKKCSCDCAVCQRLRASEKDSQFHLPVRVATQKIAWSPKVESGVCQSCGGSGKASDIHSNEKLSRDTCSKTDKIPIPPPLPPRASKKLSCPSVSLSDHKAASSASFETNDDNYTLPRILPVKQNGVKISDTHYWIIPPRRRSQPSLNPANRLPTDDKYINVVDHEYIPDPTSAPPTNKTFSHSIPPTECLSSHLQRGHSENYKEYLWNVQRGHVLRLHKLVPSATEDEVCLSLMGSNWVFEDAARRLKEEILCRTGYATPNHCHFLLEQVNWDLTAATQQAELEHMQRLYMR